MNQEMLSQILILVLLFVTNIRFFFITNAKDDSLSVLPTIALIASIVSICIFGVSEFQIILFLLTFFTFIWNFRALLRLMSNLVIDRYGIAFKLISSVNLIFTVFVAFLFVYFRPAKLSEKKLNVKTEKTYFTGNFKEGFKEQKQFKVQNLVLQKKYCEERLSSTRKIVLFIPPKTAPIDFYSHTINRLAHDGYEVYSAEFFTNDIKWFKGIKNLRPYRHFEFRRLKYKDFETYKKIYSYNKKIFMQEYEALITLSMPGENDFVLLLGDEDLCNSMKTVRQENNLVDYTFDLSKLSASYKTKGYGPVENTYPLLAYLLKIETDRTCYLSNHFAKEIERVCNKILPPEAPGAEASDAESQDLSEASE